MFICACSDIGKVREINQDSYFYFDDEKLPIFIVADGMGGHKAGEIASNLAISVIKEYYEKNKENIINGEMFVPKFINESIDLANEEIIKEANEDESLKGMGTTVTMGIMFEKDIYVGHVGDSRAYLLRDNKLIQLTHDHSLVGELLRSGSITKEEAFNHPKKNIITRALGTNSNVNVDIVTKEVTTKDIIILCTDGLTNMVSEERIVDVVNNTENMTDSCNILANTANELGGIDNITIMIMRIKEE
ncbi:protein phosphatase-2C [Gottschalkia acidurici 9a]|uniref:Protein phosphatase-2C n=1 Tax=Gottschalkia acidurici (strain ATCC 7906 / DSM 604 / BCRC 14475 / CIP 104303 / KCTC 5404 / NCIMB 10678 / 9a) TaxID=1128398 RepID=K0B1X3_GOTA9|nr:Stp1/IreP family PP2C-type Ser/Thr phosphatase [Gottschalkia acidurici]AFS78686.1 protein phosphatase-2C [Gottschalkia acidurici 9a]